MNNILNEAKFFVRSDLGMRMRVRKIPAELILAVIMLLFAVGFNLWLYRLEPTAKVDPNDNLFQYALVYRTNQMWDFAGKTCSYNPICFFAYLADHWVPNWNEGYNLPFYYSHIPQIVIVGSWRLVSGAISLFAYYHLIIYLLLCLFPISMFLAMRVAGFSWLISGFSALLASQISTDGFYGLDPPSFLWRGYGLSSQLFAMIFLPLAIAYAWKYFRTNRSLIPAVLFLILTTSGHLGIGIMAFLSLIPLTIAEPVMSFVQKKWTRESWQLVKSNILKLTILSVISILLLSYWIVPALLGDKFHNFSFWDPVWKFNSYGAREVITRFGNGELFDFGRLPIYTALVLVGAFVYPNFAILFVFWFLLYFGRTTWGNLINIIPSMKEFHLSRFIVGVHLAGLFLAPIGLGWLAAKLRKYWFILLLLLIPVYQQTMRYNDLNNTLILRANQNYDKQSPDMNLLVSTLQDLEKTNPGRVFAGRGGGWGKEFKLAETDMTMYLGNFALPTTLWLPETWSPNGDTEQYFREDKTQDYDLFNIRYVATPANLAKENIQPFWKLIKTNPSWKLYEVPTSGYFTAGVRPAIVSSDKYNRVNVVRLWIQSDDPKNGLYPELTFDTKQYPVNVGLPNFKMLDEVTFQVPDGSTHNIFAEPPKYIGKRSDITILSQSEDSDMKFLANVTVAGTCTECLVILKQSYHPDWRVTVDGELVTPIITFPFYIGIPVTSGNHTIVASYEPSGLKIFFLAIEVIVITATAVIFFTKTYKKFKLRD